MLGHNSEFCLMFRFRVEEGHRGIMKKYILAVFVVSILFASDVFAPKVAQAQCSKIVGVSPNIYKQSAPLRRGGVGSPLIGYRKEPTWIDNRGVLPRGRINVYNIKNQILTTCPWASADGHKGRARCTIQTAALRRRAIATSGSPAIRFQLKNRTCSQVPDAGRCVGSVKGLCDRLIK